MGSLQIIQKCFHFPSIAKYFDPLEKLGNDKTIFGLVFFLRIERMAESIWRLYVWNVLSLFSIIIHVKSGNWYTLSNQSALLK